MITGNYFLSTSIAFILLGMGFYTLSWGISTLIESPGSKSAKKMFAMCICVFFWNSGYAFMSMSHGYDKWALIFRAIALLSVFVYMLFVLDYVIYLSRYPSRNFKIYAVICATCSMISWCQIIQPSAVKFVEVPWGYWYTSSMSVARLLQFACVIATLVFYYTVLIHWKKQSSNKRILFIIRRFQWFGPILFAGYMADTLAPVIAHTAAIPGSPIGAFFASALLFRISKNYKAFDISVNNVSEYVFRDVTTPVLIFDAMGNPALINKQTEDFFNMTEEEIFKYNISNLFIKSDTAKDIYEIPGVNRFYKLETSNINDRFNELLYIIVFITDMTVEQNAMAELNESRMAAEAANQAKSNFLANMSHEIRTPMNAIFGMSDIVLMEDSLPEEVVTNINNIKTAGENLIAIINDILNISKIESGKMDIVSEEYSLISLLQDINSMMTIQAQRKDIAFRIIIDPTLPASLNGDNTKLREILINVIGNATKFTKEGHIAVSATWNKDENHPIITFVVKDTGIGIKEEDLDTIFGSFNQVDTRKNREIEGTGLGLAISKNMAQLMGGDITVESVYGKGSTFTITICQAISTYTQIGRDTATAISNNTYQSKKATDVLNYANKSDKRILVVDDNKINLKVAVGVMKPYKMQITTATSGYEAIELVKQQDFDLIFMDHMMPEMDGIDATKQIRSMDGEKYKSLPIIAFTANTLDDARELFELSGFQGFLAKPIMRDELDNVINTWL